MRKINHTNFIMKIKSVIFLYTFFLGIVNGYHLYNEGSSDASRNLYYYNELEPLDKQHNLHKTEAASASEFMNAIKPVFEMKKVIRKRIIEESENSSVENITSTQSLMEYFKKYPEFEVQFLKTLESICQKYDIVEDRHKKTFMNLNQHNVKLNENFQNFLRNELVGLFHGVKIHITSPPIIHSHAYCPILDEWLKLRNATVMNSSANYTYENFQYNTPNNIHIISDKYKNKIAAKTSEFPEDYEVHRSENNSRTEKKLQDYKEITMEISRTVEDVPTHYEISAVATESSSHITSLISEDEFTDSLTERTTTTKTLMNANINKFGRHPSNTTRKNHIEFLKNQHRNTTRIVVKPLNIMEKPKQKFQTTRPLPKVLLPKNITKPNSSVENMSITKTQNLNGSVEEGEPQISIAGLKSQSVSESIGQSENDNLKVSESRKILSTIESNTTINDDVLFNDTKINTDETFVLESRVIDDIIFRPVKNSSVQFGIEDNTNAVALQNFTQDTIVRKIEVATPYSIASEHITTKLPKTTSDHSILEKLNETVTLNKDSIESKEGHSDVFIVHPSNYNTTKLNLSNVKLNQNITDVPIVTPINNSEKSNTSYNLESDILTESSTNGPELINDSNPNITATTEKYFSNANKSLDILKVQTNSSSYSAKDVGENSTDANELRSEPFGENVASEEVNSPTSLPEFEAITISENDYETTIVVPSD
ncbi:uncharacterized protein LOC143910546 [Arctopsyche grandis]|uniref:uncharacterized protein LOC143910546 n=1 Tax=Arctopsyche grandis TaxID=121162 RepID=UPI00406D91DB